MSWLSLVAFLLVQMVLSAVRVAAMVLSPNPKLRPAIIAYPLTLTSDTHIVLFANMITLTPGTLSIDVSDDRATLYIHALAVESREALIGAVAAGFERRILRAVR